MSTQKVIDISQSERNLNPLQHGDVSRLVDLLIAIAAHSPADMPPSIRRAHDNAYPVIDRLLGHPPQTPSPTLALVQDIVHGGTDPERLRRVLTARPQTR